MGIGNMTDFRSRPDRYLLGSSFYPEQWPESQWENDFAKMREIGFNTVRMGEFAWGFFESKPGKFHFQWMDKSIALAARYGVQTILCTPTASVPPWLRQAYPEVLGGNERGPFSYGARKGHCVCSAALLEANDRIVEAMARHFGPNPDIIGWQLDNEPGYPFVCYDTVSLTGFQVWLAGRYGEIENLNAAWGTSFWSHTYTQWSQIEFPVNRPDGAWNPGERLDYRRFFSDSFLTYLKRQELLLRPHVGQRFIYTNWPNTFWSVDVFEAGRTMLDASAWDNYCPMPGVGDYRIQYDSTFHHDLCRCAGPNGRFLVAEQATQAPAHADPAGVRLQTLLDLAHGSNGTVFFEWRPPLRGAEQGYTSVLQMDGSFGPAQDTYRQLGRELSVIGPLLADATTVADVALLYCYQNQWDQGFWQGPDGYDSQAARYYKGFKRLRRDIDIVAPAADLSAYRLVVAPGLRIVCDDVAVRLESYVRSGGILVLNHQAGTRDSDNGFRPLLSPGVFAEMAGVAAVSTVSSEAIAGNLIQGKADQQIGGAAIRFDADGALFAANGTLEAIELRGAEPIARFTNVNRLEGSPAITVHAHGRGHVVYIATDSRDALFFDRLFDDIADRFDIKPLLDAPEGIEVTSRRRGGEVVYFLLNLTAQPKRVPLGALEQCGKVDLLTGESVCGDVIEIQPLGGAVLLVTSFD